MKKWSLNIGALVVAIGLFGCGSEAGQVENDSDSAGAASQGGATSSETGGGDAGDRDRGGDDATDGPGAGTDASTNGGALRACDTEMPNECSPGEPPRCNNNAVENCFFNPNGCWQWSDPVPCADGLSCSNGQCSAECEDECREGQRRCAREGVQICAKDHDADPCADWGMVQACPDGETCSSGECSATCRDECGPFDTTECDPDDATKFRRCGRIDADPCLEWAVAQSCSPGQTCQNNRCEDAGACVDTCVEGATSCNAERNKVLTCVRRDADMCLAPGNPVDCAAGEICCAGECVAGADTCEECQLDARKCDMNGFRVCVQDDDSNLTWSNITPCNNGMCANGDCFDVGMSVDECGPEGQRICVADNPRAFRVCGNFDADPELDLSEIQLCPEGEECSGAGECVPADECVDRCDAGTTKCEGNTVVTCGPLEGSACLGFGTTLNCPLGEVCIGAECVDGGAPCMPECSDEMAMNNESMCADNGREFVTCRAQNGCNRLIATQCADNEICPAGGIACMPNNPEDSPGSVTFFEPAVDEVVRGLVDISIRPEDMDFPLTLTVTADGIDVTPQPIMVANGDFTNIEWDTTTIDDGDVLLRAVLTDGNGVTTEATRPVIVDNGGPAVRILQPDAGETLGSNFVFAAQISDPSGIQYYEMYVGGELVHSYQGIDSAITQLPVPADLGLPMAVVNALNPQATVNPNAIPGIDLAFGPQDVTLRVVAVDHDDQRTEETLSVTFSDELIIEVAEPNIEAGFPEISRPFDFVINANSPEGVDNVVFYLDDMEIGQDDTAPYSVQIDPRTVNGMPTALCGDEDQHQLKIVVTEFGGREFTAVWCARWDTTPPTIRMTAPVFDVQGGAGIITRDGNDFPIELELEDGDDSPAVEVQVNDEVVGQRNQAPYRVTMDGNAVLANSDTHDEELTLLVKATDYLGNEGTIQPEVRVSRADWAISVNDYAAKMVVEGNAVVAFGLYDAIDGRGRIIAMRPAGQGGLYWDVKVPELRAGLVPSRGFFYGDTTAMGVVVQRGTDGPEAFIRVSEQGEVWEMLEGVVSRAEPGPQASTYLSMREPSHQIRRYDALGQMAWTINFERADSPLYMPGAELMHMKALDDGSIIIHTKKPDPNVQPEMGGMNMDDLGPCGERAPPLAEIHEFHKISSAGQVQWSQEVDGVVERDFLIRDNSIVYLRMIEGAFNEDMCMADITRAPQARNIANGDLRWTAQLPMNFEQNGQEGDALKDNADDFRSDGAYMIFGRNMHSTQTHLFAIDMLTGMMELTNVTNVANGFSPPGYRVDSAVNLERGEIVVRTDLLTNDTGTRATRLWYLSDDGRELGFWDSAETIEVANPFGDPNLVTEQVKEMSALDDVIAVGTTLSSGGARVVMIQRDGMAERWSFDLPAGSDVQKLFQQAGDRLDVQATLMTGDGVIYPIETTAGDDGAESGTVAWRVQRDSYEVAQFASRADAIYVVLEDADDNKLDILRIPRGQ